MSRPGAASQSYPPAFQRAVARVLANEGAYVDNPADPGGETRFGISKRDYPNLDIAALTREQAIAIYYRDWWQRCRYAELPGPIAVKLFDLAVNIGPEHAARCLQRALRACARPLVEDGAIGRATLGAARAANQLALLAALRSEAAGYYRTLAALERGRRADGDCKFLQGWLNRAYE
ncbi:MAG TPA: glycosyl hydrolase 108 family protein [Candidatus Binataceae bacterium]|nr:glycosyl hydrolase 108 family protein [Candidatus Binataceae bacterium]